MFIFSLADFMGCPPVGAVDGVHHHGLQPGVFPVDGSVRGEDFYLATRGDMNLATAGTFSWPRTYGPGRATAARCYRLLRTIMNTAVTDELVVKNPCQVKGAGAER